MKQIDLLSKQNKAYGGELLKTRKGRSAGRPLATRQSMHLVLRSSQAKGAWSFRFKRNSRKVHEIIDRFSKKYSVKIYSLANVGNHIHMHVQLRNRHCYRPFIRAVTAAIAMAVTGYSKGKPKPEGTKKFWDYRPYTRVVMGLKAFLTLKDYIQINKYEALSYRREEARFFVRRGQVPIELMEPGWG